jgi:hypothetical protein
MFEVDVSASAETVVGELRRRGLVVKLETFDKTRRGSHWHFGFKKKPGVLEVTDLGDRCVVRVASNRDGGWATALAEELARDVSR